MTRKKDTMVFIINVNNDNHLKQFLEKSIKETTKDFKVKIFYKNQLAYKKEMDELFDFLRDGKSNINTILTAMKGIGCNKITIMDANSKEMNTAFFNINEQGSFSIDIEHLVNQGTASKNYNGEEN